MRQGKQCPKCRSLRIGYLEREATGYTPSYHKNWDGWRRIAFAKTSPYSSIPAAEVETFICADCGYFESYIKGAQQIPWHLVEGFRWVNPPSSQQGPFR